MNYLPIRCGTIYYSVKIQVLNERLFHLEGAGAITHDPGMNLVELFVFPFCKVFRESCLEFEEYRVSTLHMFIVAI